MSQIMKLDDEKWYVVVMGEREPIAFCVDEGIVPWLERLGNFHPMYKRDPGYTTPVLRKRDPRHGRPTSIRLPNVVVALVEADGDLGRDRLVDDFGLLVEEAKGRATKLPINNVVRDCRYANWAARNQWHGVKKILALPEDVLPGVEDEQSFHQAVASMATVEQGQNPMSKAVGGGGSPEAVDNILKMIRGEAPTTPVTETTHPHPDLYPTERSETNPGSLP